MRWRRRQRRWRAATLPTMDWRLGGLLLFGLVWAGCYRESDDFNVKVAAKMCAYNAQDPDRPFLDHTQPIVDEFDPNAVLAPLEYEPYGGAACEDAVIANLDQCSESCSYSARKARRCLRTINRALRSGNYNGGPHRVCDRVYTCENQTRETHDTCRITTESCSVGGRRSPVVVALLMLAGLWARRRR